MNGILCLTVHVNYCLDVVKKWLQDCNRPSTVISFVFVITVELKCKSKSAITRFQTQRILEVRKNEYIIVMNQVINNFLSARRISFQVSGGFKCHA